MTEEDYSSPEGFHIMVKKGWPTLAKMFGTEWGTSATVELGIISIPQVFELTAARVTNQADSAVEVPWFVTLCFYVSDETKEITLTSASTGGIEHMELDEALNQLRAVRPMAWWKRKCLVTFALDATQQLTFTVDAVKQSLPERGGLHFDDRAEAEQRVDHALTRAIGKMNDRAGTIPVTRRRDRITDAVLRETAEVYRAAWAAGKNPTVAVSKHFHKAHSTAARYVGLAREAKYLGPPDGSKGGEREPPATKGEKK